jgi:hypothetical protein
MQPIQPVGRALRILLGVALIIYVAPVYFRLPIRMTVVSSLLVFGLIGLFSLAHIAMVRCDTNVGQGVGLIAAMGLPIAVYFAGFSRLPIVGHGKGQLAVVTFLAVSLVIAGARATPGCEVMAIPNLLFGKNVDLTCLIFSPVDRLERKLRR